jgi:hypothetical protein
MGGRERMGMGAFVRPEYHGPHDEGKEGDY